MLSQIYFYSSFEDEAVEWALKSNKMLDIKDGSLYTNNILTVIIDTYIKNQDRKNSNLSDDLFTLYESVTM